MIAMSQIHDPKIIRAARWLSEQRDTPANVIHAIRDKFGVTAAQAAQACTLAREYRTASRQGGHA